MKKSFKVSYDVCTFCNHQCNFCSNADTRTLKAKTSKEEFEQVMDNLCKSIDIHSLSLSAKGEVLLNRDLEAIIILAKQKYAIEYVYCSTNGSLLDTKRIETLVKSGIDSIKFSINALDRESYAKIHLKDDFDKVIENLRMLLEMKRALQLPLKVFISVVSDMPKSFFEEGFLELLGDLFAEVNTIFTYALQYTPKSEVSATAVVDAKNCLINPFGEIYINSDGSLGFCCKDYFDTINFGSLLENDFLTLYEAKEYRQMRERFIENRFEEDSLCYNCLLFEGLKK